MKQSALLQLGKFSAINCDWAGLSSLVDLPFVARQELFLSALWIQRKLRFFHTGFLLGCRCILLWKSLALSFPFYPQSVLNATFFFHNSVPPFLFWSHRPNPCPVSFLRITTLEHYRCWQFNYSFMTLDLIQLGILSWSKIGIKDIL